MSESSAERVVSYSNRRYTSVASLWPYFAPRPISPLESPLCLPPLFPQQLPSASLVVRGWAGYTACAARVPALPSAALAGRTDCTSRRRVWSNL